MENKRLHIYEKVSEMQSYELDINIQIKVGNGYKSIIYTNGRYETLVIDRVDDNGVHLVDSRYPNSEGIYVESSKKYESKMSSVYYNGHDADEFTYYRSLEIID